MRAVTAPLSSPPLKPAERWLPSSAVGRWSTLGPYYAMFPVDFVRRTIEEFCPPGGAVLDPFCGRGTVPYVAKVTGHRSLGVDLNPVAYVFAAAKTDPEPSVSPVLDRVTQVAEAITHEDRLPENEFQAWAWCPEALGFLQAARRLLDWPGSRVDRTLMAIILVHLHGKIGNAISNQMRQTKSMAPTYAVNWWSRQGQLPPRIDPVAYFLAKVRWRYRHGIPEGPAARTALGDSRAVLPKARLRFSMLLTSPPYYGVTNYRVDNWIRLWMLGEGALPSWEVSQRYGNRQRYVAILNEVFADAARLMEPNATIYVRTDARAFTRDATARALGLLWPDRTIFARHGRGKRSQTLHYGDSSLKPGEVDLFLPPDDRNFEKWETIEQLQAAAPGINPGDGAAGVCVFPSGSAAGRSGAAREIGLRYAGLAMRFGR